MMGDQDTCPSSTKLARQGVFKELPSDMSINGAKKVSRY